MASRVSEVLLSLLSEYGGGALDLVRRGYSAIRGLFGNLRAIVRPLLKEGLAFLASKLSGGAAVIREKTQKAGSELLRLAETFLGKRPEPEPESSATPEAVILEKAGDSSTCAPVPSAASPSKTAATGAGQEAPRTAKVARTEPRAKPVRVDVANTFGPVLGRALVRALSRPRQARQVPPDSPMSS